MKRVTIRSSIAANVLVGLKAGLLMGVAIPAVTASQAGAATCDAGALICNGGFESFTSVPGSDAVIFDNWTASDPDGVRAGAGSDGTGHSAEFLFSSNSLSQGVATGVGAKYTVTFDFKSEGGEVLSAYFGDTQIFSYAGEDAVPTDWTTYSFNVQAFSGQSVLRFVAESLGAAQNIDNVTVTLCPSCTPNPSGHMGLVIDKGQTFYTTDDLAGQGTDLSGVRTLTFDGGTLRPATAGALGQPGQPLTLALNVATTGGTIDNNGMAIALAGTIINTAAAATPLTLTGGGQGTIASNINNLGTLVVATTGRTTLSGAIDNAGGTLAVRDGGLAALTGNVTGGAIAVDAGQLYVNGNAASTVTVGAQGTLRGGGHVTGATTIAGTLRPGNSPGTLTFTGPVTQAAGSTLALEIDGPGTGNGAGNYSRVIVTGAGNSYTIGSGVTLTPVLRGITYAAGETAGTNSYTLSLGQRLTGVIQAEGGVNGTFATITQPTDGLAAGTRVVALYSPTSVDLYVAAASYRGLTGLTANQAAAGGAVDALEASGNAAAQPLLNALIPMDMDGLSVALGGVSGEFNANLPLAALDVSRGFGDMVATHQGGLHGSGTGWQSWGRAFGNRARTSDDGNNPGFRHRMAGGVAGVDYGMSDEFRVGFAVGYADSKVTGRRDSGRASIDSYYVGNYLGWSQDGLFIDAQAGLTFSNYETTRVVTVGTATRTASGETDGKSIGAGVEAGYRVDLGGTLLVPSAFLRYDDSDADAFTETGADFLNLSVDSDSHAALRGGLGLRLSHPVALDGGGTLLPELSARWEHDLSKPGYNTRQSLLGQDFVVRAAEPGRDTAVLGGGLALALPNNVRLTARYDAALSADRTQHGLTAQVRFAW
ncbi:autotransporter outer membrane beta-barrel domain-containing protein [Niveispirillum fermenti]|uniref:autotransporter outer membrane beta-barrel domain-containing protein n=1 Tax=Niveispirillum fermenti TaxID=1233113 RepID=UPI003A8B45DB